ncbi:Signal transduction histidine-protein kinase/phosphatase DegS [Neobacillus rhizosphaerae]|uniref:Signal transduction histidine-protein kinase/phosphatase DegS n=1 Tax=Neobacillus rhizosphaerae TaxID=2880965 RepID=A0ABM9EW60_9BACI|nr:sensor histidine kinase [Neobacillus rhizosphaerae]CAH2716876.1 Signal transduction histidine-protein kinase/phosphatase DegS [Neobacillus rhizosphaerae]
MKLNQLNMKSIDEIREEMIETVTCSKSDIFQIGEQCRTNYKSMTNELEQIKQMMVKLIEEGDQLEEQVLEARLMLTEVSMNFKTYTEGEVRDAYEKAHQLQMDLSINWQYKKQLLDKRDDLEQRLLGLNETIDRADQLISQISVVMNYLTSDLKHVGEVLENAKAKQDFGLKIIEAQEEERKRLSREIHDGPAQMLANVIMRSDIIDRVYREQGMEAAFSEITSFKKMVRSALYEVRRIIYDLRPMALDDLGLVPTLRKYLQTIEEYHNHSKIEFVNMGLERRLPTKYEVALFRMIQESVQNALKHANACEIKVKLEITNAAITVLIKDNGVGFDTTKKKPESFGIIGMRERVELLNGELTFDSKIGKGTAVLISVPLINKS